MHETDLSRSALITLGDGTPLAARPGRPMFIILDGAIRFDFLDRQEVASIGAYADIPAGSRSRWCRSGLARLSSSVSRFRRSRSTTSRRAHSLILLSGAAPVVTPTEERRLDVGTFVSIPAGVPHKYHIDGHQPALFVSFYAPPTTLH